MKQCRTSFVQFRDLTLSGKMLPEQSAACMEVKVLNDGNYDDDEKEEEEKNKCQMIPMI